MIKQTIKQAILQRNNVSISGRLDAAQTMIFAHGFGCDQNMWRFVAPAFEADYRVVLFDYVGSGKSHIAAYDPKRYDSLDGYASDLLDVCEALNLHDVIFVGHSVSSVIGMLASIREPKRFSRLVFVSPSPRYINDGADYVGGFEQADIEGLLSVMEKNYLGWASFLAPVVMKNPDRPELTAELEQSFCSTDPTAARRFAQITFLSDHRADLPKVTVPSLIIQCSDDAIAPVSVGTYIHQHLRESTLEMLDAMGHCPHMSHPADTVRLVKNYLDAAVASV